MSTQVPKADIITSTIAYNDLLASIKTGNSTLIQNIKTPEGATVFSVGDAAQIITALKIPGTLGQIERCEYQDVIAIKITRKTTDASGREVFTVKDLSQLSLGQQQSILLSILLFSTMHGFCCSKSPPRLVYVHFCRIWTFYLILLINALI